MRILVFCLSFLIGATSLAQNNTGYWQQRVEYKMEIDMDVDNHRYKGKQELKYYNNSPDTLYRVFYHLYFNAFQPGSEMDEKSLSQYGSDRRLAKGEISVLNENEVGFIKVSSFKQDGVGLNYEVVGTVLEVDLNKPILPGQISVFNMVWNAQIPVQIRRSGRNNAEGIAYSMSQWFPKMAEYDFEGWHADPYIDREFHGVWGDYDVRITIDDDYTIGGTGYLKNPAEVGHGYQKPGQKTMKPKDGKYTWHFFAPDVHDFAWAADNEYIHDIYPGPNGVELHFFYKNDPEIIENWKNLQPKTAELMRFFNEAVGEYPYKQYSVVQGGDGGMEYPMSTLITGVRSFNSLVGVTSHELAHSWFHGVLATNESKHEWMDEGFASYVSGWAMNSVMQQNKENPTASAYMNYKYNVLGGKEQPLSTHADRYSSGQNYAVNAYSKGAVFLAQLGYVVGKENLDKTLKRYYSEFKFKHPTPNDFIRVAEKVSGAELDWYLTDFTQTTNTIDYGILGVDYDGSSTIVSLERRGLMPMPIDLVVTYQDGTSEYFYIPLQMMRAEKSNPYPDLPATVLDDWAWAFQEYRFTIPHSKQIKKIEIDPSRLMADIHLGNNVFNME
jgi:hypothetical protein